MTSSHWGRAWSWRCRIKTLLVHIDPQEREGRGADLDRPGLSSLLLKQTESLPLPRGRLRGERGLTNQDCTHWCFLYVKGSIRSQILELIKVCVCVCVCVARGGGQSHLTLCNPMDCSPPGSSVHGILPVRRLEWVAMPSSRRSSPARD